MPWTVDDVDEHMKDLTAKEKETWVAVANRALAACEEAGRKDCDASAIRQANSVVGKMREGADGGDDDFEEAATFKSLIQRLLKSAQAVAENKNLPVSLKRRLVNLRNVLTKTYEEMPGEEDVVPATEAFATSQSFQEIALRAGQSVEDFQRKLRSAVQKVSPPKDGNWPWIVDVFDDRLVYSPGGADDSYQEVTYTVEANGSISLGPPVSVERVTTYRPILTESSGPSGEEFREDSGALLEVEDE